MTPSTKVARKVLVTGATGGVGSSVGRALDAAPGIEVVRATRKAEQVAAWAADGRAGVHLDLDDPRTFPEALAGIDSLFIMTGYTMTMVTQVKTLTDAAVEAGVRFIVHLGVFGNGTSTDPHYAWHELVERYIAGSGVAWCHVHPNFFMENLLSFFRIEDDTLTWPMGAGAIGWVAGDDLAAVAAKVLADGPEAHAGRSYPLSSDVVDGPGLAAALSRALGRAIRARVITPDDLKAAIAAGRVALPPGMDAPFIASMLELEQQIADGRLAFAATRTDTVRALLDRDPVDLERWAREHKDQLLGAGG